MINAVRYELKLQAAMNGPSHWCQLKKTVNGEENVFKWLI